MVRLKIHKYSQLDKNAFFFPHMIDILVKTLKVMEILCLIMHDLICEK